MMEKASRKRVKHLWLAAVIILAAILPFLTQNNYHLLVLIVVYLNCALAVTIFPVIRMGLLFLAQGGFMAIGAYTSALLVTRLGVNSWLAMLAAGTVAAIMAAMVGYPTLRVKGLYFLLVTFGLNEVITIGLNNWDWVGGPSGIFNIPPPSPIPLGVTVVDFSVMQNYYYFILLLALLIIFVWFRLWSGKLGRIIRAVNNSEELARSVGIAAVRYKLLVVVLSCFVAGIMGSFTSHLYTLANPAQFGIWTSFSPIIFTIVGGMGFFAGPIVGTIFLTTIPEFLRYALMYRLLIYAILLIVVMLFFPSGLMGIFQKVAARPPGGWRRKATSI